jgi:hypothetical protein
MHKRLSRRIRICGKTSVADSAARLLPGSPGTKLIAWHCLSAALFGRRAGGLLGCQQLPRQGASNRRPSSSDWVKRGRGAWEINGSNLSCGYGRSTRPVASLSAPLRHALLQLWILVAFPARIPDAPRSRPRIAWSFAWCRHGSTASFCADRR